MADTFFIEGLNTLPEQVQINKDNIKTNTTNIATNTADITKLKDDISKINPNAWEERKINFDVGEGTPTEFTTYNPITDINAPVNIQKVFTDKDIYTPTDVINSYSFVVSSTNLFAYVVCADPSITFNELIINDLTNTLKNAIILQGSTTNGKTTYDLNINCKNINADRLRFGTKNYIDRIEDDYNTSNNHALLTGNAIWNHYLSRQEALNMYLKKTDASNTYVTKQDYDKRFDTGVIALTEEGFNKIKAMTEEVGTTITLTATTDFSENVQLTNTRDKELILGVNYDVDNIYRNIHVMPNQTIDDYDALQGTESTWYTGHAMLTLPSEDNGYFAISYQNGTHGQLILTLLAHY